jgi:uncharacterized phage protein (TIGR01671 family)
MKASRFNFRAWDLVNDNMLYNVQRAYDTLSGRVTDANGKGKNYYACCFSEYLEDSEWVVMQSTGLLDDSQKTQIFEGDILKAPNESLWVVKFGLAILPDEQIGFTAAFYAECISNKHKDVSVGWYGGDVVGNIYENPELMEATNDR